MSTRPEVIGVISVGERVRVRTYENLSEMEHLLPDWDELLSKIPSATSFSTWQWLASWWRAYGHGRRLTVLAFLNDYGTLVALAPLSLTTQGISDALGIRVLRLMGDGSGDSDNLDLPVLPGYEEEFVRTLLQYLEAHGNCWDVCQFNTMPDQGPAGAEMLNQLKQRGWPHHTYRQPHVAVPLPDAWDSYLRGISSKERGKLSYYSRRLEKRHQVRVHKCSQEEDLARCLEALFRLHQMRWRLRGEQGSFHSLARRGFYEEVSHLFLTRNWLEFWLLDLDGETVAAQFGFRYGDTVFQLQEGYDPAYSSDSVGYVLRGHVLRHLIAAGVRRYDFLGGEDQYDKARWNAQAGSYMDIHFSRPTPRSKISLSLVSTVRQNKEWLRRRLPKRTWQTLRRLRLKLRQT